MKTEKQINDDYWLASETTGKAVDDLFVLDSEGDIVFKIPPALGPEYISFENDEQWFAVLIDMAGIAERAKEAGARNGERYGRQRVAAQLHELLGVDRITQSIDLVANEVTTLANAVSNLQSR